MRALVVFATCCFALPAAAAPAAAAPTTRKIQPSQLVKAAGAAFTAAATADEAGDLRTAIALYAQAWTLARHASIAFNLADVNERAGHFDDALAGFTTYLALEPDAPDRVAVAARIQRLAAMPGTLTFAEKPVADRREDETHDLETSYILLDGVIVVKRGTPPGKIANPAWRGFDVPAAAGPHTADIVSAVSYGHTDNCATVRAKFPVMCTPKIPLIAGGNVVVSVSEVQLSVTIDGDRTVHNKRFTLPAGSHLLAVRDRSYECAPVRITIPTNADDVRFVFLQAHESKTLDRCRALTIRQQVLAF